MKIYHISQRMLQTSGLEDRIFKKIIPLLNSKNIDTSKAGLVKVINIGDISKELKEVIENHNINIEIYHPIYLNVKLFIVKNEEFAYARSIPHSMSLYEIAFYIMKNSQIDYEREAIKTTLSHEIQHMIKSVIYQKLNLQEKDQITPEQSLIGYFLQKDEIQAYSASMAKDLVKHLIDVLITKIISKKITTEKAIWILKNPSSTNIRTIVPQSVDNLLKANKVKNLQKDPQKVMLRQILIKTTIRNVFLLMEKEATEFHERDIRPF